MENSALVQANRKIKAGRPKLPITEVCHVFKSNDLLEIGFLSKQCRNDAAGSCIMCDYGCANGTKSIDEYITEMQRILNKYNGTYSCLLLCTNGSFLDEYQIDFDLFKAILNEAKRHDIPEIEIETHYRDVTDEKLRLIREAFPGKKLTIELGLETTDQLLQNMVVMKKIDIPEFGKKVHLIQEHGFNVDINIMLGMPFLSPMRQFEETRNTMIWAFERNCNVVVFPVNIKPFTLLFHMHQNGFYTPISQWLSVILLDSFPDDELVRITLAWYGNREQVYSSVKDRALFPTDCPSCSQILQNFFSQYNALSNALDRRAHINQMLATRECDCLEREYERLRIGKDVSFEEQYGRYVDFLKAELKI